MSDESSRPGSESEEKEATALLMKVWSDGEAEVVCRLLEAYGIPCQATSHISHTVFPVNVDGLGEVRLLVPAGRLEDAKGIVAEHRRQGMEMLSGGAEGEGSPSQAEAEGEKEPSEGEGAP